MEILLIKYRETEIKECRNYYNFFLMYITSECSVRDIFIFVDDFLSSDNIKKLYVWRNHPQKPIGINLQKVWRVEAA